jgi:Domain of unknown function (DUF4105)
MMSRQTLNTTRLPRNGLASLCAWAFLVAVFLFSVEVEAENRINEGRYKIHVLTMDPGGELFARFGHIALMVEDSQARVKKVYNFGTFDFDDPNLRVKYARGFLNYWLSVASYRSMVRRYRVYNRTLIKRTLGLTSHQAALVVRRLEVNARPRNREYAYRHYWDNCCTRIRDLINDVTEGALFRNRNERPTGRTFRFWTKRALAGFPTTGAVMLFSLGPAIDRPITRWDEHFLPEVLAQDMDRTRIGPDQRPLVSSKETVLRHLGPKPGSRMVMSDLAIALVALAFLLVGLIPALLIGKRPVAARFAGFGLFVWGLLAGLAGLMLVLYWTATTHYDTHYNENLLIMPVFHLWLLRPAVGLMFKARLSERMVRWINWYFIGSFALIAIDILLKIGPFIQSNWGAIGMAIVFNLAAWGGLLRAGIVSLPQPLKS